MALDQVGVNNPGSGGSKEMSFFDHLEELRWHIIRSLLAIVVAGIVLFIFQDWLFGSVLFGPTRGDFISYRILCALSEQMGMGTGDAMCLPPPKFTIQAVGFAEPFVTSIKVSFLAGLVLAFPYVFYEIWRFISPGLLEKERRASSGAVFICSFLFLFGVFFGYFVVAPFGVRWLGGYTLPGVENQPTLSSLINYMVMFTLPTGLMFELPVVVYVLARIGLVTAAGMRKFRRYAVVLVLIVAGVLTPPDPVTQFLVGIPMYLLYEASIYIAARVEKRLKLQEASEG
jgi:sec-independent protein translocase protein TatC